MALFLSAARAGQLQDELTQGGYPADTPCVVAYQATWPGRAGARVHARDAGGDRSRSTSCGSTRCSWSARRWPPRHPLAPVPPRPLPRLPQAPNAEARRAPAAAASQSGTRRSGRQRPRPRRDGHRLRRRRLGPQARPPWPRRRRRRPPPPGHRRAAAPMRTLVLGASTPALDAVAAPRPGDAGAWCWPPATPASSASSARCAARVGPAVIPAVTSVAQAFARLGLAWDDALVVSAPTAGTRGTALDRRRWPTPRPPCLTAPGAGRPSWRRS